MCNQMHHSIHSRCHLAMLGSSLSSRFPRRGVAVGRLCIPCDSHRIHSSRTDCGYSETAWELAKRALDGRGAVDGDMTSVAELI
jgi:hypothetical protein